jgi:hypothetical protein
MKSTKTCLVLMCLCLFVISLVLVSPSSAKIDKKNVMGVWLLNDGADTVKDSSPNKNNGTIKGKPKWVEGKFGKALEFDGTSGVEIIDPEKFNFTTWTYSFWFRSDKGGDYPNLIGRQFGNAHGWTIHLDPGRATFRIRIDSDGGVNQVKTVAALIDGDWHHGVICQDDSKSKKLTFYYDGIKGEATYGGEFKNSGGFMVLGLACVGAVNLNGAAIDDFAVFDTILAEEDILTIMEKGLEAVIPGIIAVTPEGRLIDTWGKIKENSR